MDDSLPADTPNATPRPPRSRDAVSRNSGDVTKTADRWIATVAGLNCGVEPTEVTH